MPDSFCFFLGGVVVTAILASAWRFERNSASYREYLKREEEHLNREGALLARQEQVLERIESLVEQLVQKLGAEGEKAPAQSAIMLGGRDHRR